MPRALILCPQRRSMVSSTPGYAPDDVTVATCWHRWVACPGDTRTGHSNEMEALLTVPRAR
jgi:hypothetical protein